MTKCNEVKVLAYKVDSKVDLDLYFSICTGIRDIVEKQNIVSSIFVSYCLEIKERIKLQFYFDPVIIWSIFQYESNH